MNNEFWDKLQVDIAVWATHNFGDNPAWQPMLGLIEEIGEFYAAEENAGNSLTHSQRKLQMEDAIGDQTVYALNLASKVGLNFYTDVIYDNYPQSLTAKELLGCLGLACHAVLKNAQGIRNMTNDHRKDKLKICLSMWYRWACSQVSRYQMGPIGKIVETTWQAVSQRNWAKFREDAHVRS